MRFSAGTRRGLFFKRSGASSPPAVVTLPTAGPFAGLPATPVSGLSDQLVDGMMVVNGSDCGELAPLQYNLLTVSGSIEAYAPNGGNSIDNAVCGGIFLRVNELNMGPSGTPGSITCHAGSGEPALGCVKAGSGGNGASGGGGGAAAAAGSCCGCGFAAGGAGGSGLYGGDGNFFGCGVSPGFGGIGVTGYNPYVYSFGSGGSSPSIPGGNGFGGGGSGQNVAVDPCNANWGGGGGGGAGLVCIVGNLLSGGDVGNFLARGGAGGDAAEAGGDGVIWLAFKHKTAANITMGAFNTQLYKINANNSLTAKLATDVW